MTEVIHILLADDHEVVRSGLKAVLRGHPEFTVVAEARDGIEAVREAKRVKPDLAVLDVRMARLGGIDACREIRKESPETNVMMLTSYADDAAVMASIVAGASGFMLKDAHTAELIEAMRIVGRGGTALDAASSAAIINQVRRGNVVSDEDRLAQRLNERELQVLDFIAAGMTNREIGEQLFLSEKTVKHNVSEILEKLGLSGRIDAATFATRRAATHPREG